MTRVVKGAPDVSRRPVWPRSRGFVFRASSAAWRMHATRNRCSSHRFLSSRKRAKADELVMKSRGCFGIVARRARTCCAVTLRGSCAFFYLGVAVVTAKYPYGAAIVTFWIKVLDGTEGVVKLPEHLEVIQEGTFEGSWHMEVLIVPAGVQTVEKNAFASAAEVTVRFMSGDTVVKDGAFSGSSGVVMIEENSALEAYFREKGQMYLYLK